MATPRPCCACRAGTTPASSRPATADRRGRLASLGQRSGRSGNAVGVGSGRPGQLLAHPHHRHAGGGERRDRRPAAGGVERHAGQGGGELGRREPLRGGGRLGPAQHQPADAAAGVVRMGVHRADAGGVAGRVEQGVVADGGLVAAEQGRAPAPAAAAGEMARGLDHHVGAVRDQLRVQPHHGMAGGDQLGRQEVPLQPVDRERHQRADGGDVGHGGEAVGEGRRRHRRTGRGSARRPEPATGRQAAT